MPLDNLITNKFFGDKEQKIGNLLLKISSREAKTEIVQHTFDTPFPNACLLVLATENDGTDYAHVYTSAWNKNGFTSKCTVNAETFYFLAIGY